MHWIRKIEHAEKQLKYLEAEINTFFATHPYKVGTERDSKSKRLTYYVLSAEEIPQTIPLITGDVLQNLRSSLDHLAYQLYVSNTGDMNNGRHIYFPISKDLTTYEKEKHRRTKGISQKALDLIDSIKPYKGGNNSLWKLHELNNIDKHRLLITVGSAYHSVDVGAVIQVSWKKSFPDKDIKIPALFIRPADSLFPLAAGAELFSDLPEAGENPSIQFKFNIVLNEPGITEGDPLLESLQTLISDIKKLVPNFRLLHAK